MLVQEERLCKITGFSRNQIYEFLLTLSRRRILHYIPGKKASYITFTRKREDTDRVVIPPEVYEKRKESYEHRINAMVEYVQLQTQCRARTLLRYFGEKHTHDCMRCDVCLSRHASGLNRGDYENIRQKLLACFAGKDSVNVSDLNLLSIPPEKLEAVITYMVHEEEFLIEDGKVRLSEEVKKEVRNEAE